MKNRPVILPKIVNIVFCTPKFMLLVDTSIMAGPGVIVAINAMVEKMIRFSGLMSGKNI